MRAVLLELDPDPTLGWLAERRRLGLDKIDEMWEGVLHVVPPPSVRHQDAEMELSTLLRERAHELGLRCTVNTGVFDPEQPDESFRVPDIVVARPDQRTHRGIEGGAVLAVEILSPNDETYDKLPFYAARGVEQLLVVDPRSFRLELYGPGADGYRQVEPADDGALRLHTLDLTLWTVPDAGLDVRWPDGRTVEVRL
jgi:Uma2 family endonuclease